MALQLLVVACKLLVVTCGIQFPDQGWTQAPCAGSHWATKEVPYLCNGRKITALVMKEALM